MTPGHPAGGHKLSPVESGFFPPSVPRPVSDLPVLYSMPMSHYCICAERVLALKGISARVERVAYHDKQDLLRATGQDYVPALVWKDGTVVPWDRIPEFLERAAPRPSLFPTGQRALAETLDQWAHQVVEEKVWRTVVTRVAERLEDPVERWVFEEMQSRVRGSFALLDQRRAEFERDLEPVLTLAEGLVTGRDWILGEPSLADAGLFGGLAPLRFVGLPIPQRFPHLGRWHERVAQLSGGSARREPLDAR